MIPCYFSLERVLNAVPIVNVLPPKSRVIKNDTSGLAICQYGSIVTLEAAKNQITNTSLINFLLLCLGTENMIEFVVSLFG